MVFIISVSLRPISRALIFFLITAIFFPFHSAPTKIDRDELGRVELLEKIVQSRASYQLFLIDSFERQNPWEIFRGNSFLNHTEFISKKPENEAYTKESAFFKNLFPLTNKYSFMIHSYVEQPGIDKVEIRPKSAIYFPLGIPIRLIFWVYSENVDMTAKLILEQKKSSDIYLDLGSLKFEGWRRLEVKLNIPPKNLRLIQSLQIPLQLKGIRLSSSPFQQKGPFFIYLDQMTLLLETSVVTYPGSEVKDNWGD
ncbi:flagellar filament outer layer protein FlaA [Leptospira sp. GIMC2001]|uniref:flagellar filament outer layer protein FlaA n=1 Tax=Leptospira sp. GIMC2001 TaxID=1513297 RepID=UPI002349DC02|nr:flagellar filament outer layer protein FlaA [Leptospira sp. GIMC2001]WCL48154.1 flagellar assembly protein FlaA [Leptospira sp. GIMC2001]